MAMKPQLWITLMSSPGSLMVSAMTASTGKTLLLCVGDNVIPGPRWFAAEDSNIRALTAVTSRAMLTIYG